MGSLASLFVAGLGAILFGLLTSIEGSRTDWSSVTFWYLAAVAVTLLIGVLRPRGFRNAAQLGTRVLTPLALAGVTELALMLRGPLAVLGTVAAMIVYLAVWLVILAVVVLAVAEIIMRAPVSLLSFHEGIFALLDRWQLSRPLIIKVGGPGVRLELVREESPLTGVWLSLFEKFVLNPKRWGIGLSLGLAAALILFLVQAGMDLEGFLSGENSVSFAWWLIPLAVAAISLPEFIFSYFVEEWERRHDRFVATTTDVFIVRAKMTMAGATVYLVPGKAVDMKGAQLHSPDEVPGKENPDWLGRIFDALVYRLAGVQDVEFGASLFGVRFSLKGIPYAHGTWKAVAAIRSKAKKLEGIEGEALKALNRAKLAGEMQSTGTGSWAVAANDPQAIVDAWNRLAPLGSVEVDLWTVQDPGLWDPKTGDPIESAVSAQPAKTIPVFPTVED